MANTILITDAGLAEVVEAEQGGLPPSLAQMPQAE